MMMMTWREPTTGPRGVENVMPITDAIIPSHQWTHDGAKVRLLKFVAADGVSHSGFRWPESGPVICPRAEADRATALTPTCDSGGLFGWPWGIGPGGGKHQDYQGRWIVFEADPADVVMVDGDKAKVIGPAEVIFSGPWWLAWTRVLDGAIAWTQHAASGAASATGGRGAASATGGGGAAAGAGGGGGGGGGRGGGGGGGGRARGARRRRRAGVARRRRPARVARRRRPARGARRRRPAGGARRRRPAGGARGRRPARGARGGGPGGGRLGGGARRRRPAGGGRRRRPARGARRRRPGGGARRRRPAGGAR